MKALYIDNFIRRKTNPIFTQIWLDKKYKVAMAANFTNIDESLKNEFITYHHIDFIRNPFHFRNIRAFKQLLYLLKKEKYDLIHCNSPVGGLLGRLCGWISNTPKTIYTAHGFHFYKGAPFINWLLYYPAEVLLAHFTDALITINTEDYEIAKKFKYRKNGKAFYIPGVGIDTSLIENASEKRNHLLSEINAKDNDVLIISAGELNLNKNNHIIIKALGKLNNPKIHYLLCGIGDEGNNLEELAKACSIEKNVHFMGYRSDINHLLKSCDIFVMPSYREGLSRSMMEAMAAGLPCIASKIRGNVDLIKVGKGGYLFHPDDVSGFASAIKELADNKDLRAKMGDCNKEAVKQFDIDNVKKMMLDIYKEVLSD